MDNVYVILDTDRKEVRPLFGLVLEFENYAGELFLRSRKLCILLQIW